MDRVPPETAALQVAAQPDALYVQFPPPSVYDAREVSPFDSQLTRIRIQPVIGFAIKLFTAGVTIL